MAGLRERKKAEKLRRIREAAWALFAERGYAGTTTRDVCRRAGIGTGTLFLYVEDKHDLLVMVFRDRLDELQEEAFATLPDAPLLDQLVHVFDHFLRFYEQDPRLARELVRGSLFLEGRPRERLEELNMRFIGRLAALVGEHQARGTVRADAPAVLAASSAFALYYSALLARLDGLLGDHHTLLAVFRSSLELLLVGLNTPERG